MWKSGWETGSFPTPEKVQQQTRSVSRVQPSLETLRRCHAQRAPVALKSIRASRRASRLRSLRGLRHCVPCRQFVGRCFNFSLLEAVAQTDKEAAGLILLCAPTFAQCDTSDAEKHVSPPVRKRETFPEVGCCRSTRCEEALPPTSGSILFGWAALDSSPRLRAVDTSRGRTSSHLVGGALDLLHWHRRCAHAAKGTKVGLARAPEADASGAVYEVTLYASSTFDSTTWLRTGGEATSKGCSPKHGAFKSRCANIFLWLGSGLSESQVWFRAGFRVVSSCI